MIETDDSDEDDYLSIVDSGVEESDNEESVGAKIELPTDIQFDEDDVEFFM